MLHYYNYYTKIFYETPLEESSLYAIRLLYKKKISHFRVVFSIGIRFNLSNEKLCILVYTKNPKIAKHFTKNFLNCKMYISRNENLINVAMNFNGRKSIAKTISSNDIGWRTYSTCICFLRLSQRNRCKENHEHK